MYLARRKIFSNEFILFKVILKYTDISITAIVGGMSVEKQHR
jgi:hypothetical protein